MCIILNSVMQVNGKKKFKSEEIHGLLDLSCNRCNKKFSTQSNLNKHMRMHMGQFKNYCDKCKRGFVDSSHYKDHMNEHEGIQYVCEFCNRSFKRKREHQYHLSVHTGEYRFKCEKCCKGFNMQSLLKKHVENHL